jgi:hypothetical protein
MKNLVDIFNGFKNAFSTNIQNDYPIKEFGEIYNKINEKIKGIDIETNKKIIRHTKSN